MKKSIIISDSFKGSLSTFEIMDIFEECFKEVFPNASLIKLPIADGGEGTVDAFSNVLKGNLITCEVNGANNDALEAKYLLTEDNIAIIEVASVVGLPITKNKNPLNTTTYGIGQLIKDAIKKGARTIILGLGGSSTNDMGCGIAHALGYKFIDKNGNNFIPTGKTLNEVVKIKKGNVDELLKDIKIIGMCDVTNPLVGENGASLVYSIQKGASQDDALFMDKGMEKLANMINPKNINVPGAGAAGGIGYGILTFLNGKLQKGVDTLLELIDFDSMLKDVDCIFTGEGKYDSQTLNGKVVQGIQNYANKHNIPVVVITGGVDIDSEKAINEGIEAIVTTNRLPMEFDKIKKHSKEFYRATALNTLRLIKLGEKLK